MPDIDCLEKKICSYLKVKLQKYIKNEQLVSFNKLRKPVDIFIEHLVSMGTDFTPVRARLTKLLFLPLDSQMFRSEFVFNDAEIAELGLRRTFTFQDITTEEQYCRVQQFLGEKAKKVGITHRVLFDLVWNDRFKTDGTNLFLTNPRIGECSQAE